MCGDYEKARIASEKAIRADDAYADYAGHLDMLGYVEDVREAFARYAVFVCPILSGSGVRVKLLEAFARSLQINQ